MPTKVDMFDIYFGNYSSPAFENTQQFLLGLHLLASEKRLSRFVYVARKP
jgi:hypothetical protein